MAFTLADADAYFSPVNHMASSIWLGKSVTERTAALAYARRQIERMLGDTLSVAGIANTTYEPRQDYALYEQALHVVTHNPFRANGELSAVGWTATQKDGSPQDHDEAMASLCKMAIHYLGWNRFRITRA